MEKMQPTTGNRWNLPFTDAQMADKLTSVHATGFFELILGKLPEAELPRHVIKNHMAYRAGVGERSVKVKEMEGGPITGTRTRMG